MCWSRAVTCPLSQKSQCWGWVSNMGRRRLAVGRFMWLQRVRLSALSPMICLWRTAWRKAGADAAHSSLVETPPVQLAEAKCGFVGWKNGFNRISFHSLQRVSGLLQLREAHREDLAHCHPAIAVLLDEHELLRIGQTGGNHHFPARLQLLEQRRRNEVGSRGYQHFVERRVLGPAMIAVAYPELDIGAALPLQSLLRLPRELFDDLDAVHLASQLREHGGVITQPRADLEDGVAGADVEQVGHQRDNERLRDRLVEADRKRDVGVGIDLQLDRHELVSRHPGHGRHHTFVERGPADHAAHVQRAGGNLRQHVSTQEVEIVRTHGAIPRLRQGQSLPVEWYSLSRSAASQPGASPLRRGWQALSIVEGDG